MKKHVISMLLVLLLCLEAAVPILAADKNATPEFKITWLSVSGRPISYNRELNWLTVQVNVIQGDDVIDLTTNKKIEEYNNVHEFSEGLALVHKKDANGNSKYGFIDKNGTVVIPLEYDSAGYFSEGLAHVAKIDANGNPKYGFIDKSGTVVIPLEYDSSDYYFSEGLARVAKIDANGDYKWGFINQSGIVVVPLEYADAHDFSEGLAYVSKWDENEIKGGFIDKSGTVVTSLEYNNPIPRKCSFSEGLAAVYKKDANGNLKCGFIDKSGAVVIPLEYYSADDFSEGLARVYKRDANERNPLRDTSCGLIDKSGAVVVPVEYDGIFDFYEGLAEIVKWDDANGNLKHGFIDKNGAMVVPVEYDELGQIDDKLYYVKKGMSWGIFENPYWSPDEAEERDNQGGVPVLPALLVGVVAVAAAVAVLMLKKKKPISADTRTAGDQ